MIVKPLQHYLLVEVTEFDDPKYNIIIPERLRKKIPRGKVLAKGDYVEDIEVGDVVVFDKGGSKALQNNQVLVPDFRIHLTQERW